MNSAKFDVGFLIVCIAQTGRDALYIAIVIPRPGRREHVVDQVQIQIVTEAVFAFQLKITIPCISR